MNAAIYLVLDNLLHGWPYRTNLELSAANNAYAACLGRDWIRDCVVTDARRAALLVADVEGSWRENP